MTGGGEPTSHLGFEEAVKAISDNGYRQRIHTNGILFSKATYNALESGDAIVFVSVDSGTKKTFMRIKGHDKYDSVWRNIAKYVDCSPDNVFVKFNVMNYNSDEKEIDVFLDKCRNLNVKNIVVSAEITSYCRELNAGPFYFTEKEFNAAHYLYNKAKETKFNVYVAKFAFQVRGEYDEAGNLMLPKNYYDNIDHEAIVANIKIEAFPTVDFLLGTMSEKEIVIFCGNGWGTLAYRAFNKAGMSCVLIDSDDKVGDM
ncbi:MAG: hypothetical protein IKN43_12760, partial [Selenomonadaceae bacterium]|nr:hypothetical protein [Selenomonadaceae bacterium]